MNLHLICAPGNDLFRVLHDSGLGCASYATAREAVSSAPPDSALLALADGYPEALTPDTSYLVDAAQSKALRLYVEFPEDLPGVSLGSAQRAVWERAVAASDAFAPALEKLRILAVNGCCYRPVHRTNAEIVIARVAGFDTAVYGLPEATEGTSAILFRHPRGEALIATTKLSQFITARYAPMDAWQTIWQWILTWLCPHLGKVLLH